MNRRQIIRGAASGPALLASLDPTGAAEPTRLIGALEEDPPVINPAITTNISTHYSGTPVYSALTRIRPDGTVEPDLAERWEMSPDGKTYTFHLRRNVTWHDGHPFTAADVKFSIENANAKLHPTGRGAFKTMIGVDTPDDYTAVIRLSTPSAAMIYGTDSYAGDILPKHLWEGTDILKNPHNQVPIGTGPYKLAEYKRGEYIRYVKNTAYFLEGKPEIDEIILRIIPDAAGRVAAFEKGELDVLYHNALPWSEAPRLAKIPGVAVRETNLRGAAYLGIFNTRRQPLDNRDVRRAIAHAIDRSFIRQNVAAGFTINMVGPVPPVSELYKKDLVDYAYDVSKANQMLDAAGLKRGADGVRFNFDLMWPNYDTNMTQTADIIVRNLADVGIRGVLQPLDRLALNQKGYVSGQFSMIMESYGQGPDPDLGVERLYNSNNIQNPPVPFTNTSSYSNLEVDKLFDEQRVQIDPARRNAIYGRIQELIWADLPILPIFSFSAPNAYWSSRVSGVFTGAYGNQDPFIEAKLNISTLPATGSASVKGWPLTIGALAVFTAGALVWRRRRRKDVSADLA